MASIEAIEGIGPAYGKKLVEAGIKTTEALLKQGATKKGRKEIAEKTGIDESRILTWVNMADLFRINGVASQYAELLEAAGVDTVKELRNRNAANLTEKMAEVNEKENRVRQVPSLSQVEKWVEEAKNLEPMVTY